MLIELTPSAAPHHWRDEISGAKNQHFLLDADIIYSVDTPLSDPETEDHASSMVTSPDDQAITVSIVPNAALDALISAHSTHIYRFVLRRIGNIADAEDITQQTLIEASLSYPHFRGDSKLSTWLYGIALNMVRKHRSRAPELRYEFVSEQSLATEPCPNQTPLQAACGNELVRAIHHCLKNLPIPLRDILMLSGLQQMTYEEIAHTLDVPVGTVRSRLSRAREALRRALKEHEIETLLI